MNIKGLTGIQIGPTVQKVEKTDRMIKSDSTHDRDANGQQAFGDQKKDRGPMSDEKFQKCIEHLKNLPSVKEHSWVVEPVTIDGRKFVYIKDNLGTLIRKIPEVDLWTLEDDKDSMKGHLLKKTA